MISLLRDLIFTPSCISCSKFGEVACKNCLSKLISVERKDILNIDSLICAGEYSGWLRDKVIAYKSGNHVLGRALAQILLNCCFKNLTNLPVVPIPTSNAKIKIRQIDTIGYIAKQIHLLSPDVEVWPVLKLAKNIPDQVGLSRHARASNLQDAFSCKTQINRPVVILDDVVTTGATLASAAKTLKAAGASQIYSVGLCAAKKLS